METKFNEKQLELFRKIGLNIKSFDGLTDDEILEIDERLVDYLTECGIDEDDTVNEIGIVCLSLLDLISEL